MKNLALVLVLAACVFGRGTDAAANPTRSFRHSMEASDRPYRLESVNTQTIRVDGRVARRAEIVTRALLEPKPPESGSTSPAPTTHRTDEPPLSRHYSARYYLTETDRRRGEPVGVRSVYESTFERSARGEMTIADRYVMPVIRNYPVFPEREVSPGDQWSHPAWEIHDFREVWGAEGYLRFDFPVSYRYEGPATWEGLEVDLIRVEYNIAHRTPYPGTITGHSQQRIYWNHQRGRLAGTEEEYWIRFHLSSGQQIEYEGYARTSVYDEQPLDREAALESIREQLREEEVPHVVVQDTKDGIVITLEEIGFPPDSAKLQPAEEDRLRRIATVLGNYPDNGIMVTGHTALAGTAEGRNRLSIARARAVGEYLLERGVRSAEQILYRGLGATEPVADNSTEEGRSRNRRVEITILDN
ncbi:MAG: OmpA family protein [Spirochaetaceae bacterium]|nr:MAG: OmpA family protein [Spirochaetaceae bacterium]